MWTVQRVPATGLRYLRVRTIGPNWKGDHALALSGLDLYGRLWVRQGGEVADLLKRWALIGDSE
jgi:hypothetical protein